MGIFDFLFRRKKEKHLTFYARHFQPNKKILPKMQSWQWRESPLWIDVKRGDIAQIDNPMAIIKQEHEDALNKFRYQPDFLGDYWATSKEVEASMEDDCDGFAVLMWSRLYRHGFPEDQVGMVIIPGNPGHMFACWHDPGLVDDFWVIDNNFISNDIVLASSLFPIKRKKDTLFPLAGFNMNRWWMYKRK